MAQGPGLTWQPGLVEHQTGRAIALAGPLNLTECCAHGQELALLVDIVALGPLGAGVWSAVLQTPITNPVQITGRSPGNTGRGKRGNAHERVSVPFVVYGHEEDVGLDMLERFFHTEPV